MPFKATAGLHHPVRAEHALTYEPDSPRAVMNGFLNVFVAAIARPRVRPRRRRRCCPILEETSPDAFAFADSHLAWRDLSADARTRSTAARTLARSFGSCSFEEPIADLDALGVYL